MDKLKKIIKHYGRYKLEEKHLPDNPYALFAEWMEQAVEDEPREPNAMTLATVDKSGRPSARIMLLKSFDENGFVFFTNYESRKGGELEENPFVALVFWWPICERQVRVEGQLSKVSVTESDEYFASRSRDSRLGALASQQSRVLANRQQLDDAFTQAQNNYANQDDIPRPSYWGGFRVIPNAIEFWQGGQHRLHDRIRYEVDELGGWSYVRLAP